MNEKDNRTAEELISRLSIPELVDLMIRIAEEIELRAMELVK